MPSNLRTCTLVILASLALLLVIVTFVAHIFAAFQQPIYVNRDLLMQNPLHIPTQLQPRLDNGEKVFDLAVQKGWTEFLPGQHIETLGYDGNYLGPTLRAQMGDHIRVNVTNHLDEATTVHWHGMDLPALMDGGPHQAIQPGASWQPTWTVSNQAATLWYHSHLMDKTGKQVYMGLAGLFIIDDPNSLALNLPNAYGVDDIPLVTQDRAFDHHGQLFYDMERRDAMGNPGMLGEHILVNGVYAPYLDAPAKQIRLRLLNGSNARRYNFGFDDDRTFHQIATDGGLLEAPVSRTRMILAPGERAEILVDLTHTTQPMHLLSYAIYEENTVLRFAKSVLGAARDENQIFKILEIRPQASQEAQVSLPPTRAALPHTLNTIEGLSADDAIATRRFILDAGNRTINGKQMDHHRIDETIYAGSIEIWEIVNLSGTYHPFHIHAGQFLILTRNNRPPAAYERGWKDTVLVRNGEAVRVIMRFPEYTDSRHPFMYHCHILEHEDMGMMGQFVITSSMTKR